MLDPLDASSRITSSFRRYLATTFQPRRQQLRDEFEARLRSGFELTKGPYLEASPPFEVGRTLGDLIDDGVLSTHLRRIDAHLPLSRPLYRHQDVAVGKAVSEGRNLVIATGTGSGKTECFLLPIINGLCQEIEAGTISEPGVRALLLYPMNALANDQVKRLRILLEAYPEITFGRYVGETAKAESDGEQEFRSRYPNEPRLPNELLSREEMQECPPHILLTNYAMLEYLLLRPADSPLFDGTTGGRWRWMALDEAHVYSGAQGTEVAMLLRRVKDRVASSGEGRIQCFATSATLGRGEEDHPAIVEFAERLFGEPFEWDADPRRQDVVRADKRTLVIGSSGWELRQEGFGALQESFRSGASAEELHRVAAAYTSAKLAPPASGVDPETYMFKLLHDEATVIEAQRQLERQPTPLSQLASRLFTGPTAPADVVSLVDLCVSARPDPDASPLIPARYHFFVRSLEGAYVCLHPEHREDHPRLVLDRHEQCPSCRVRGVQAHTFELCTCRSCGAEHVVGTLAGGRLRTADASGLRYYLLQPPVEDDDDEVATGVAAESLTDSLLCPGCGAVGETAIHSCACDAPPPAIPATLVSVEAEDDLIHTCAACRARSSGDIVFRFVTGVDAPVSVVATDLYQSIPESGDLALAESVGGGRKLLAFSDSRQDAAFFAPYLERTYQRAVQRRLIMDQIVSFAEEEPARVDDLVREVEAQARLDLVIDPDSSLKEGRSEVGSWVTLELLALDRRQSLEGVGLADIRVRRRRGPAPRPILSLGFTEDEVDDLIQTLLETVRVGGAITTPSGVVLKDERFRPRNFEFWIREGSSESKKGILSWLPAPGAARNRRSDFLAKVFERKGISADHLDVLAKIWTHVQDPNGPWGHAFKRTPAPKSKGTVFQLDHTSLEVLPRSVDHLPHRCDRCQRLSWRSVAGVCPTWRCEGTLVPERTVELDRGEHYASLYRHTAPIAMAVEEHTAQWRSEQASKIQDDFVAGRVNALSCSTTFELGVDVGEVQAVLLRNVPPSAANYVQRAGRAGRRTDSAAFVVTYAQRRSHDLTWFANPLPMIEGRIDPPQILLDNVPIVRRHAHSVAFAAFERHLVDEARPPHARVAEFFGTSGGGLSGDAEFVAWLRTHPSVVSASLSRVLPPAVAATIGTEDWAWVDALTERTNSDDPTFGWLARSGDGVREDLERVRTLIDQAAEQKNFGAAHRLSRVQATIETRDLLGHLASTNVLPKYGFPVDVVGLNLTNTGEDVADLLELDRDLKLAVTQFAPGGQTVAAKQIWESAGLGLLAGKTWPAREWALCSGCGAFRQRIVDLQTGDASPFPCEVCQSDEVEPRARGTYVIPLFGFVGRHVSKAGDRRPPRVGYAQTHFADYEDKPPEFTLEPMLSGQVELRQRSSRQGRIVVVNNGPGGRGFRLCQRCGHAEPVVSHQSGGGPSSGTKRKGHDDIRKPSKDECRGWVDVASLGHTYLTDVVEIDLGLQMDESEARSVLYALLEAATSISISRADIDGALRRTARGANTNIVLIDAVPGGAGHARRMSEHLPELFEAAYRKVVGCECGEETSCYSCLRGYANQPYHSLLSRGAAKRILGLILGGMSPRCIPDSVRHDLELIDDADLRSKVEDVFIACPERFAVVYKVDDPEVRGWSVEVAWPGARVAITVDDNGERDSWLRSQGWTVHRSDGVDPSEITRLVAASAGSGPVGA